MMQKLCIAWPESPVWSASQVLAMLPGYWPLHNSQSLAMLSFEAQPEGKEIEMGAPRIQHSRT